MAKILIVLAVATVAFASPHQYHLGRQYQEPFAPAVAPEQPPVYAPSPAVQVPSSEYEYSYSVNDGFTGDRKDQVERRDGDIVQGSYSLVEPDGLSRRVVDYSADDLNGFNAVVHNEPAVAAVRAEPVAVATPAVRAEPIAVAPAVQAHYAPTPAIRAEPVAVAPAVQAHYAPAPAIRAEPVAVAPAYQYSRFTKYTPTINTEVAVAPSVRTHVNYAPVVRHEPVPVGPPAVSHQTISHTTKTVHPPQIGYRQIVENIPYTTQEVVHEPVAIATPAVRAEHYEVATPVARAEPIAVAPAIHQTHFAAPAVRHEQIIPTAHHAVPAVHAAAYPEAYYH
ncbi:hypothetical protein GE061_005338 [Apolygus lucorum]|uniref:Uncharacterized protein n=1 Tax=Apolygus lucorum TaxID=248454 RepID=A0A6A4IJF9_APOLU|nr:hypothetical protein GE061_005338 [Apolygus lucorum]